MRTQPWWGSLGLLLLLCGLPWLLPNDYYLHLAETILIYTVLLYGLDIVVGYTGQVSLGHAGLFGVGAYVAGVLSIKLGLGFWLAIPAALLITALFGGLLALPALRVVGPYLAMVTLAFGTILQILINEMDFLTDGPLGIKLAKPWLGHHPLTVSEYYATVVAIFALATVLMNRLVRSHWGRAFEALRDSPIATDCMGVSVYRYKVLAFVLSAGFAGVSGCLYAYSEQYISPNTYNFELTILFLLAIIMGGRKSRLGALLGSTIIVLLPKLLDDIQSFRLTAVILALMVLLGSALSVHRGLTTVRRVLVPVVGTAAIALVSFKLDAMTDWRLSIFGVMILLVVYYLQDGIVGFSLHWVAKLRRDHDHVGHAAFHSVDVGQAPITAHASRGPESLLEVADVVMAFGGLKALNAVSYTMSRGSVLGLIGPNGSGKSTMMNVLTGLYKPTAGHIAFKGLSITGKEPSAIARSGIARTFQNVQLFGEMTVLDNVLVGLHHRFNSGLVGICLRLPAFKRDEDALRTRGQQLLQMVGLHAHADELARNLPYGKQRLLEIARALALDPELLLLDEPAAGLTAADITELLALIEAIRAAGVSVVLIEHHMDVIQAACDHVIVFDFGEIIAAGVPAAVQANPKVIEAYLGA